MERDKLIAYISDKIIHHANKPTAHIDIPVLIAILTSLTAPEREVKEEEMELAGLKLQNKLGDRIVTFNYTFVAGAKWMQDKLTKLL